MANRICSARLPKVPVEPKIIDGQPCLFLGHPEKVLLVMAPHQARDLAWKLWRMASEADQEKRKGFVNSNLTRRTQ